MANQTETKRNELRDLDAKQDPKGGAQAKSNLFTLGSNGRGVEPNGPID